MLSERTIDLVCLKAAEIHNLGRSLSDSRAQAIIDEIRGMLEAVSAAPAEGREALAWRVEWERGGQTWVRTYTNERDAIDDGQAFSGTVTPLYPLATAPTMSEEARDVMAERRRQVEVEGWTPEHDDEHDACEMADAAAAYALHYSGWAEGGIPVEVWPADWSRKWWKPTTPRRDLVKAGALILAEIERIDRAAAKGESNE